jgi:hypothetical protein
MDCDCSGDNGTSMHPVRQLCFNINLPILLLEFFWMNGYCFGKFVRGHQG